MTFHSNLDFNNKTQVILITPNPETKTLESFNPVNPKMNPQKNYNHYPNSRYGSTVRLATPVLDKSGRMEPYLCRLSKTDKIRAIKKYKTLGVEEDIKGYCRRCDLIHPFARKSPSNVHYNCEVTNCCSMIHQWDVCNYCLADIHGPKPKHDDKARRDEVARFHHVFSQLPDDLKRYVIEYVPLIFNYIDAVSRVVIHNRKLATIDTLVNTVPKTTWKMAVPLLKMYNLKNKANKSSSRQQICNRVKELYKNAYTEYTKLLIDESNFWTHKPVYYSSHHTLYSVRTLEEVNDLL